MYFSNIQISPVQRILDDISAIIKNPISGTSLCLLDRNDPFVLHGNFVTNAGAYRGILVQISLQFPADYPKSLPIVRIAPSHKLYYLNNNQGFSNSNYEDSIFDNFTSVFTAYLAGIKNTKGIYINTTEFTISFVLRQLQLFFADPDLPRVMLFSAVNSNNNGAKEMNYTPQQQLNSSFSTVAASHTSSQNIFDQYSSMSSIDENSNTSSFKSHEETPQFFKARSKTEKSSNHEMQQENPEEEEAHQQQEEINFGEDLTLTQQQKPLKSCLKQKRNYPASTDNIISQAQTPTTMYTEDDSEPEVEPEEESSESDIKREASKFTCSITHMNVFDESEPVLGYPIDLRKDRYGRIWATPIMEIISYEAYMANFPFGTRQLLDFESYSFVSPQGSTYNFWLPLYISEAHFKRAGDLLLNAILTVYKNIEGKRATAFEPYMVLKVLPPILVKTMIHFLKGTIDQSTIAIDIYIQTYRLFIELVKLYPNLTDVIDFEVEKFCLHEKNRHKTAAGDLGEFIIKLAVSSRGVHNTKIMNMILKENLARQISWACEKDGGLKHYQDQCPNLLKRFMFASKISNQYIAVQVEAAKLLLNPCVKQELEMTFGLLKRSRMENFIEKLTWIQQNISADWKVFIKELGQEGYIPDSQTMTKYVLEAFNSAHLKGYLQE